MAGAASAAPDAARDPPSHTLMYVSFYEIYEHLERARQTCAPADLQRLLEARLAQLRDCGAAWASPSAASRAALQKDAVTWRGHTVQLDDTVRGLGLALSDRLHLDEIEAAALLRTYLASEHRTLDARDSEPGSERFEALVDAVFVFFLEEQLALIRCVSALLRIAEDAHNELFDMASAVLDALADDALAHRCLTWFEHASTHSLAAPFAADPRYAVLSARHSLERQLALLEVAFLLYYGRLPPTMAFADALLGTIERTHFGQRQASAGFFDDSARGLLRSVRELLVFLAIECLNLEAALEAPPAGALADDAALAPLAADPAHLDAALRRLEAHAASDAAYAPLLLGLALVLRRLDEYAAAGGAVDDALARTVDVLDLGPPMWQRLAQGAFDPGMELLPTLHALVSSPLLGTSAHVFGAANLSALAYRAVFKGLLLTVSELVQPEYLPDLDALVDLWYGTFRDASGDVADGAAALCLQFWTQDLPYPTRTSVLDTARRRFPASLRPLVRLARALSGTAPEVPAPDTAASAADLLMHLPTLALVMPPRAAALAPWQPVTEPTAPSVQYELRTPLPVAATRLVIPAGTRGTLVSPPDEAPAVVLWQLPAPVSAWHVLHDTLAYRERPPARTGAHPLLDDGARAPPTALSPDWDDAPLVATETAELFADMLSADDALGDALLEHLGADMALVPSALRLVQEGLAAHPVHERQVCAGYHLLQALLPLRPNDVWQHVRSTNVLVGSPGPAPLVDDAHDLPPSPLVAHGAWRGALALLSLLAALLAQMQAAQCVDPHNLVHIKARVLARACTWAADTVWVEPMAPPDAQASLVLACLRLWDAVLRDPCLEEDKAAAPLVAVVERVLGDAATPLTLRPLLSALDATERTDAALAAQALRTARTLVTRPARAHPIRACFLGTAPEARGSLVSAVLAHVAAAVPPAMATAAAQLVTDVVRTSEASAFRWAGHLGSTAHVDRTVRGHLQLLSADHTDGDLRAAVWRMLAALLASQPALATLLLTGGQEAGGHTKAGDAPTALQLAAATVRDADLWTRAPDVLEAVLFFLYEAWGHALAHPRVFAALRKDAALFDALGALLRRPTPFPLDDAPADETTAYAHRAVCQARVLQVLELDVQALGHSASDGAGSGASAGAAAPEGGLRVLRAWLLDVPAACEALGAAMDTVSTHAVRAQEAALAALLPHVPLAALRLPPRRDDYDQCRTFGPAYMYAMPALAARVPPGVPEAEACAARVGLAWSALDAQAQRAHAWANVLRAALPYLLAGADAAPLQRALSALAQRLAPLAAADERCHVLRLWAALLGATHARLEAPAARAMAEALAHTLDVPAYALPAALSESASAEARTPLLECMLAVILAVRRLGEPVAALSAVMAHAMHVLARLDALAPLLDVPSSEAARRAEYDLDVLVAVVQAGMACVPPSVWLHPLRETSVLRGVRYLLAHAPLAAAGEWAGAPRTHVRFFAPLVRLLEALAAQPAACELLAHAGIVRALGTHALSAALEDGCMDATLPSGEPSPMHAAWLLVLRTVVRIVENVGAEARAHLVDADVDAFVHMCGGQLRRALAWAPLTHARRLDVAELHEVRTTLRLFHGMWAAKAPRASQDTPRAHARAHVPLGDVLAEHAPRLLPSLAYLATHAAELRAWLGLEAEGADALARAAQVAVDEALGLLLALLWALSSADLVLTHEPAAWPQLPALIAPTLHVAPGAPASLGTLLELASTLTARSRRGEGRMHEALEQCIGLCATQALIWAKAPAPPGAQAAWQVQVDQAHAEVAAGLGRDLVAAVQAADEANHSAWWDVLRALEQRYMARRYA
ncbi:Uncharacterized protein MSYG_3531 [Malassezia sympodialis ATCC 42132]|uniref:Uncharacterized protein n=1 Tax=Malassezia sympodialis (strain ATCC 42132) TaxID=1230383 RepID=A0A1M8A9P9_MALS4|nr:Uncharacterized protein MSYG_3531 [Malassezia sympodialis ATCC 42132]